MEPWGILVLAGFAAGVASGLLGIGGGLIMTPVLHYGLGYTWHEAILFSLVAIAIQTPVGLRAHHQRGAVDWWLGLRLSIAGAVGVIAGLLVLPWSPVRVLKLLFVAVLVWAAVRLARPDESARAPPAPMDQSALMDQSAAMDQSAPLDQPAASTKPSILVWGGAGAAAGAASRLLGIGGGLVTVPALTLAGTPVHVAVGTSLVPVFFNALVAAAFGFVAGMELVPALVLGVAAMLGTTGGTAVAHAMRPGLLRLAFAVALVLASGAMAYDVLGAL